MIRCLLILRHFLVVDVHLHATDAVDVAELCRGLLLGYSLGLLLVAQLLLFVDHVELVLVQGTLPNVHLLLTHVLELLAQTLLILHDLRLHVVQMPVELKVILTRHQLYLMLQLVHLVNGRCTLSGSIGPATAVHEDVALLVFANHGLLDGATLLGCLLSVKHTALLLRDKDAVISIGLLNDNLLDFLLRLWMVDELLCVSGRRILGNSKRLLGSTTGVTSCRAYLDDALINAIL